jgi:hypothetical protein
MVLKMVISGAQTGADIAGLEVATNFGLKTGGIMPFGYKTLDGPMPQYRTMYDIEMHSSSSYVPRTRKNVKNSDGTMRLAFDFESRGEVCTKSAIVNYKKPWFDVDLRSEDLDSLVALAITWIEDNNIEILNVAGNSESTYTGTHEAVTNFLTKLFKGLGLDSKKNSP